jgi:hypothetical protein
MNKETIVGIVAGVIIVMFFYLAGIKGMLGFALGLFVASYVILAYGEKLQVTVDIIEGLIHGKKK